MLAQCTQFGHLPDALAVIDGGQRLEAHVDANTLNGRCVDLGLRTLEDAGHVPLVCLAVDATGEQATRQAGRLPDISPGPAWAV